MAERRKKTTAGPARKTTSRPAGKQTAGPAKKQAKTGKRRRFLPLILLPILLLWVVAAALIAGENLGLFWSLVGASALLLMVPLWVWLVSVSLPREAKPGSRS